MFGSQHSGRSGGSRTWSNANLQIADAPRSRDARIRAARLRLRPQVQKLNRNSIYLFVNGRLIRDRLLLHALSSAYHNLMPPACYPFALLFLDCDCRGSGRQRSSVEDRGALPARIVRPRFRARRDSRRADRSASRIQSAVPAAAAAAGRGAAVFRIHAAHRERSSSRPPDASSQLPSAEDLPVFTLQPTDAPAAALRFLASRDPRRTESAVSACPTRTARLPGVPASERRRRRAWRRCRDLRPLGQIHDSFIIAAGRDGCGSSTSTWRTSASCLNRCCGSGPRAASSGSSC